MQESQETIDDAIARANEAERQVGKLKKELGMARADTAADGGWKARVDAAISDLAGKGFAFTAETVRAIAGDPPSHPNAMGARFNRASAAGLIVAVGFRESERPTLHRHPIRVWMGAAAAKEGAA